MWFWFVSLIASGSLVGTLCAQGFDWIPTYLRPFRIPQLYGVVGITAGYVRVDDPDVLSDGTLVCARYGSGGGTSIGANVGGEWWILPDVSVNGLVGIGCIQSNHSAPGSIAPLVTGEQLRTEYVLSTSRLGFSVQAAAKKRLAWRYSWASLGLDATIYAQRRIVQTERVIEPTWYFFSTTPPSKQVQFASTSSDRIDVLLSLTVAMGYDVPLTIGWYSSPSVYATVPLALKPGDYRLWRIGITVPVAFPFR